MNPTEKEQIYFIGIGGIGMSALARYTKLKGKEVAGYDKTPTALTRSLNEQGIPVIYEDEIQLIPESFKNANLTLVVYTPAVPPDNKIYSFFLKEGFTLLKRSEFLGKITENEHCLAIAGTHGKTTTSSLLAHLLKHSGMNITAFLGGISQNYHSNLILDGNDAVVVEADEFDRSFLRLKPYFSAVTSMDADHLDIYQNKENLDEAFRTFVANTQKEGKVFVQESLPLEGIRYGFGVHADYRLLNVKTIEGVYHFDIQNQETIYKDFEFSLPGEHNLLNATLAFAMAKEWGVEVNQLKLGLKSFEGVERRFTYHIKTDGLVLIDDYAHHPTEIAAAFEAVNTFYPNKKKTVVFQPHLFSRTKDFAVEFAKELAKFDEIFLLEIYPAREKPISGVDSNWLLCLIDNPNKRLVSKENLIKTVQNSTPEVIITLGAGDISDWVEPLKNALIHEN
ncbi:MAG: UDP-N-acetylmuramate--L-alanine ligase [Flavobacteriaceae bacterium]|nr:UDP-N-acetylmuramate--L-alanine ligase [Flavobacteriaceae bacterium]